MRVDRALLARSCIFLKRSLSKMSDTKRSKFTELHTPSNWHLAASIGPNNSSKSIIPCMHRSSNCNTSTSNSSKDFPKPKKQFRSLVSLNLGKVLLVYLHNIGLVSAESFGISGNLRIKCEKIIIKSNHFNKQRVINLLVYYINKRVGWKIFLTRSTGARVEWTFHSNTSMKISEWRIISEQARLLDRFW